MFKENREHTEIEQVILEKICYRLFGCLHEAWASLIPFNISLAQTVTNLKLVNKIYPADEMGLLATFEIVIGEIAGIISIYYPYSTLSPIHAVLSTWLAEPFSALAFQSLSPRLKDIQIPMQSTGLSMKSVSRHYVGEGERRSTRPHTRDGNG